MYRFASNRPQQLFRQLITTSLTAGSLLLMPLIGSAHVWGENTTLPDQIVLDTSHDYTIHETAHVISTLKGQGLVQSLFYAKEGDDFQNIANLRPVFLNYGTLTHVRDDYSDESATFRILADNFSFTNATTGQITIGKNYPTTRTWRVNGLVLSGKNGVLTNDGEIEGQGDYTVVLGGSNNTVTNSGTLKAPTNSSSFQAVNDDGDSNRLDNSGTIETHWAPVVSFGTNFTLLNQEGGVIKGANGSFGVYTGGENGNITNNGSISAAGDYGVSSTGENANITNSGSITSVNYGVVAEGPSTIITNSGSITSVNYGVVAEGPSTIINNTGTVISNDAAWTSGASSSIINSGNIASTGDYGASITGIDSTIRNTGVISAAGKYGVYSNDDNGEIANSGAGTISAAEDGVYSKGNNTTITNDGSISTGVRYGIRIKSPGVNADITNKGSISSSLYTYRVDGFRDNTLVNSGTISSTNSYAYRTTNNSDVPSENITLSNENTGVIEAENVCGVGFWGSNNISVTNAGTVKAGTQYAAYLFNDEDVSIANSGTIEAGDDTVAILGGKNILLTNTGNITSNGTVAIITEDLKDLTLKLSGTITGDINLWTGDTAPETYTPTVNLNNGLTLNGDLNVLNYDSSDITWPQVSKLPTEKSSEQVALEDKIQALEEALQSYAPSKKDGAVPEPLTADLSKEETLKLASHVVREEDSQEQREKETQLRTELQKLQSELDTLTEAEVDKAAAVPHDHDTVASVGSAKLSVGAVNFGTNSSVSIVDTAIVLKPGFTGGIPFSSESSGNSFSVGSGEDVRVVGLSPAAKSITIAGTVGYIATPEGGSYTANLTPSGSISAIELGGTAAEPVNLTVKTTGIGDGGASTTASTSSSSLTSPQAVVIFSSNPGNTFTFDSGQGTPYCLSLLGSSPTYTFVDAHGQDIVYYPGVMAYYAADNCHTFVAANAGLLDARYDKLSDKIINLDHKLQDGNTDWLFEVRYQDHRKNQDDNQPHANSTILALSKLWHTTRGDWIFQASHDSMHIGQHLNNNSASIVLGHSQNWGKTSELHMQLGGDRREMSLNLVGDQETVRESSNYSIVYGEIGMGRVLHKLAGHDINMRMRLAAERIGSIGKGWDSDTVALMIPELSVSGRVLPSLLTDASHRLYAFAQKPIGDTKQKYTITGHSESTLYYDTDVSGGIGYDLHTGVGANTMLHAKASYLNTGYLSLGLGISQNL